MLCQFWYPVCCKLSVSCDRPKITRWRLHDNWLDHSRRKAQHELASKNAAGEEPRSVYIIQRIWRKYIHGIHQKWSRVMHTFRYSSSKNLPEWKSEQFLKWEPLRAKVRSPVPRGDGLDCPKPAKGNWAMVMLLKPLRNICLFLIFLKL